LLKMTSGRTFCRI